MNNLIILVGKTVSYLFRFFNLGNGSTWPGHIALQINKHFISDLLKNSAMQIIIVAGTNGKTTTSSMIRHLLETDGKRVLLNQSGANLLNGIASTILLNSSTTGKLSYDFVIFEVDENALPYILKELTPDYLVLLNLFRDQLDRYGEVHTIADKWEKAISELTNKSVLVLNADDPEIAWLGLKEDTNSKFFGLNDTSLSRQARDHAVDSTYCPKCNSPLEYKVMYYSHLGDWHCPICKLTRPDLNVSHVTHYPLAGTYNQYNTHAAVLIAKQIGVDSKTLDSALQNFKPAFGRQEVIEVKNKRIQIFLSKNPISFNQSLETIQSLGGKNLLIVLNDRVADGHDVSWIWDTNLEQHINHFSNLTVSGDRYYDLGLRLKYVQESQISPQEYFPQGGGAHLKFQIEDEVNNAIHTALDKTPVGETLYILPTYTAMLDVRKIITGKKIL